MTSSSLQSYSSRPFCVARRRMTPWRNWFTGTKNCHTKGNYNLEITMVHRAKPWKNTKNRMVISKKQLIYLTNGNTEVGYQATGKFKGITHWSFKVTLRCLHRLRPAVCCCQHCHQPLLFFITILHVRVEFTLLRHCGRGWRVACYCEPDWGCTHTSLLSYYTRGSNMNYVTGQEIC